MKKIVSVLVFALFATTAFAQISLDSPSTNRHYKNHRGVKKGRKGKHK
jgi:hypothetical protein